MRTILDHAGTEPWNSYQQHAVILAPQEGEHTPGCRTLNLQRQITSRSKQVRMHAACG